MKSIKLTFSLTLLFSIVAAIIVSVGSIIFFGDHVTIYFVIPLIFILVGAIFYFIYNYIIRQLNKLSKELSKHVSTKFELIDDTPYPHELKSYINELNQQFSNFKRLLERNKRFSADAAHELRTPLTALKTQAQIALQMTDPTEQRSAIENVLLSVDRSIHIVKQLLTLSRLDHEEGLNDIIPVNLETISAEIIALLYPTALEKNIEVELINECEHTPIILGNDATLGILLRNLIDNAIRYTPNGGEVTVTLIEKRRVIILSVIDNGPGIPEEYHDQAFDRFFRILGTRQQGSGLGLAIVKQITDLHSASIRLKTPPNGKGLQVNIAFLKPGENELNDYHVV
ncbi:MAG: ATP-binding protein [Gammaproteobacteria bacterium]